MEDVLSRSLGGLNILDGASSGASIGFSIGKQGMFLDPNITKMFQEFTLFMQQQQRVQAIEEDITRALGKIINKFGKFEGHNITKFLQVYTCEMEVCKIPEAQMISNFHLAIVPGIHEKVKKLLEGDIETWSKFEKLLKKEFIDKDDKKITKKKFLDWIWLQLGMHMDLYEFLEEFERRFYQLSFSERRSLDAMKIELFLHGVGDAWEDKLLILIANESTESGCTDNWEELKEVVVVLAKQHQKQVEDKKPPTLNFISSLSMQEINLEKREIEEQVDDFNGRAKFLQKKEFGSHNKGGEGKNKESFQTIIVENQGIQNFEGNMEFKDLDINDNEVENYGYSTLNKFVQVGDSNLDGSFLGNQKAISTFKGSEDVLSNTLDYVEEVEDEFSQEMDYGSIQGDDHEGYMNSQHYDVRGGGTTHGYDDESQMAYNYKTTRDFYESNEIFQEHEISQGHKVTQHLETKQGYDILQGCIQEDMRDVASEDYGTKDKNAKSLDVIKLIVSTSLLDQGQSYMDNAYEMEAQLGFDKDKINYQAWDSRIENLKSFIYKDMDNGFKDYTDILNGAWNEKNKKKVAIKMYMAIQERIQLNLFISKFIPRQWFGHVQKKMFPIYLHMLHTWNYWHMPEDVQV
jgi:hypothetical protein